MVAHTYLGTEFTATALADGAHKGIKLYYLANVDSHTLGRTSNAIDLERTLWVVVSKSYTTKETLHNLKAAIDL